MQNFEIERLLIICPKIELALNSHNWNSFCISRISQTRTYLRCCYISFKNLKLELLELDKSNEEAKNFAFYKEALEIKKPSWVAIGIKVKKIENANKILEKEGIKVLQNYLSEDSSYSKGFRHHSALISSLWCGKRCYITEYDDNFYRDRENAILDDNKKRYFVDINLNSTLGKFFSNENYIEKNGIVTLEQNTYKDDFVDCDWIQVISSNT